MPTNQQLHLPKKGENVSSQDQEFEEQDQDQDEGEKLRTGGAQRQRSGGCWIIVLIVGLVVAALLYGGARIGSGGLKGGQAADLMPGQRPTPWPRKLRPFEELLAAMRIIATLQ